MTEPVLIEINAVPPASTLPTCIRQRLEESPARKRPVVTLESIHRRLQLAAKKRQV